MTKEEFYSRVQQKAEEKVLLKYPYLINFNITDKEDLIVTDLFYDVFQSILSELEDKVKGLETFKDLNGVDLVQFHKVLKAIKQ